MQKPEVDLLIIGLDSLDSEIASQHSGFSQYNIQAIQSIASVNTQAAWPTIYTGLLPGEHGVQPRRRDLKEPWDQLPHYLTFFEQLKMEGHTNIMVGMPMTYSSALCDFGEYCLAGFPLAQPSVRSSKRMYYPASLVSELGERYKPYLWVNKSDKKKTEVSFEALEQSVIHELEKVDICVELVERTDKDVSLLAVGFQFPDILGHARVNQIGKIYIGNTNGEDVIYPLSRTYDKMYEALSLCLASFSYKQVVVISDHGAGIQDWKGNAIIDKWQTGTGKAHRQDTTAFITIPSLENNVQYIRDVYNFIIEYFGLEPQKVMREQRYKTTMEEEESIRERLAGLGYL